MNVRQWSNEMKIVRTKELISFVADSSMIKELCYLQPLKSLFVVFINHGQNTLYQVLEVPEKKFWLIKNAPSQGKAYNKYIKGQYKYVRLADHFTENLFEFLKHRKTA